VLTLVDRQECIISANKFGPLFSGGSFGCFSHRIMSTYGGGMKQIDGVCFERKDGYAVCHLTELSEDLKSIIRKNLRSICHGSLVVHEYGEDPLYSYVETLNSFFERYDSKTDDTKKGMIGELLTHVLFTELFDEFDIATAFFNLEENSIKKGFDLIMFRPKENVAWITEVKSGELHKGKNVDETTSDLLYAARADLYKRLNEQKKTYWYNAVNSVRNTLVLRP
jgi:hypothetical protein